MKRALRRHCFPYRPNIRHSSGNMLSHEYKMFIEKTEFY